MAKLPVPLYHCTQPALYSVCDTIAGNLLANLPSFTGFKGKYTAGYVTAYLAQVEATRNIPDLQARGAAVESYRVQLIRLNRKCLVNWQSLRRYIEEVYPKQLWKPKKEAAGSICYAEAANKNWKQTIGMNTSAVNFLVENNLYLQNGGTNMPAGFPTGYKSDADAFDLLFGKFLFARETYVATAQKILASNQIYSEAIDICKDGQVIFSHDRAYAKLFNWNVIMNIVNPSVTKSAA